MPSPTTTEPTPAGTEIDVSTVVAIVEETAPDLLDVALSECPKTIERVRSLEELFAAQPARAPGAIIVSAFDARDATIAIEPLAERFAGSAIALVCASIERWELRAALNAGAVGVLTHERLDRTLPPCLDAILAGQLCVPRAHHRVIAPPALSTREKQILGLVVMGYMNSEIAGRLFLAESTVKSHLSSVFGKLGVRSRNEAVSLVLDPERGLGVGILGLGGEPIEPLMDGVE
jgi:DNA-binding NarL/FixJ family response regulator